MKKTLFLLFIFINSFISCAPLPSSNMKTDMSSFKKEGMIAGTLSLEDKRTLSEYKLIYVQIQSGTNKNIFSDMLNEKKTDFVYNRGEVKFGYSGGDFKEGNKDVYLFNIIKPDGKYRIIELDIFHNSGSQLNQYSHKIPVDITFEIEEGKVKYLGEIKISINEQKTKLVNKIERDRIKFKEKNSNIAF